MGWDGMDGWIGWDRIGWDGMGWYEMDMMNVIGWDV